MIPLHEASADVGGSGLSGNEGTRYYHPKLLQLLSDLICPVSLGIRWERCPPSIL